MSDGASHIGTLREAPLHASLKRWCSRTGDRIEELVDGYVIDVVRDGLLIEVQTRGFSAVKQKVSDLLALGHRVRIVHPIPLEKWIVKVDGEGRILGRRRSPRRGAPSDVFAELVSFPDLVGHDGLEVAVLMTVEEELRRHTPTGPWRRRGWRVVERRLVEVVDTLLLQSAEDLAALLPDGLPDIFTTADIADRLGRPRRAAQQMAYCLRQIGSIVPAGKTGNAVEYRVA